MPVRPRPWMLTAVLAALCAPAGLAQEGPRSIRPEDRELSKPLRRSLRHLSRELRATEFGRRLLAVTADIPVVERGRQDGPAVRFVPGKRPVFVVDKDRAPDLSSLEFEVLFVRARSWAASRIELELVDMELAAHQAVLEYAVQKVRVSRAFEGRLRKATASSRERIESSRRVFEIARSRDENAAVLFPGRRPDRALERLAFDLYVFSEDPYLFYEAVKRSERFSPEAVELSEVEDFLSLHGDRLDRVSFAALGRVALVEGRPYPGRVGRAALKVRGGEGLSVLREGLGLFRTEAQRELKRKVNAWIRETPG